MGDTNEKPKHPLRRRDFRLLFGGLAVSTAGDWLYGIALIVYVFERTHSPAWIAAASILRLIPYVLIGPLAGTLADRFDKRLVMLVSNLVRAAMMFAIALLAWIDAPLAPILGLAFVSACAGTVDGPAIGALVPVICPEDELGKANASLGTVENVAMVVGPGLGSILVLLGSIPLAIALNAVTFLIGAACALALSVRTDREVDEPEQSPGMLRQFREGIVAATSSPGIVVVMSFLFIAGLFYGHELVLVVLIAEEKLGTGSEGIGWLNSAVGIGGVAAAGVASRMAASKRGDLMLLIAIAAGALPYAVLSLSAVWVVALGCMVVLGAAAILIDVIATTLLQRTVDPDLHGRILALVDSVTVAGILLGSLIAPVAVETLGLDTTLLLIGTVPLLALFSASRLGRLNIRASKEMEELAPTVALLRASPLFAESELPALEAIASVATRRTIPAGSAVVTEGQPASDIYLVVSGAFDVISRGERGSRERVNTLAGGDHFGEIGVLARVPRTATVAATKDSEVLEIPGSVLLDVVNREPTRSMTIIDATVGRLSRTHPKLAASKERELLHGA